MADWDGLRHGLERAVSPPPIAALRERRRRRRQRRAIATTFALVLVGSASGVALLGQAGQQRGGGGSTAALNVVVNTDGLPPPKDYEDYVVTDIDFVSRDVGWSIGLRCVGDACDIATWRTGDGGRTWSVPSAVATGVPRTTFREESPSGGAVRSLRMVDERNGFAFNPGLYVTDDGGATWRQLDQRSKVTSISLAGSTLWVTERGCPAGVDCDLVVRAGTVGGELRALRLPETDGASAVVRRAGERNGYLLAWGLPRAAFYRTTDAGKTWTEGGNPCPDATAQSLSAGAGRPIWLVCTTPSERSAYQSDDHGTTWRRVMDPPAEGVVTDLVARSAHDAYLTTQQPARLFVTSDAGATWQRADGTGGRYGYSNLDVVDATHAWAMGDAGLLWRTTDGKRWERLALPPQGVRASPAPVAAPTTPAFEAEHVEFTGLWFLDARTGWAVGRSCIPLRCRAVLRGTSDGGTTWQDVPAPAEPFANAVGSSGVNAVVFADERNGFLYGHDLWLTHDAGATWRRVASERPVRHVAVRDGFAWAVDTATVRRAAVGTDAFETVLDDLGPADHASLVLGPPGTAYVFTAEDVHVTADGGQAWARRTLPCAGAAERVVSETGGDLWAMCGYDRGGGTQRHSTAHSSNGARTWTEVPSAGGSGNLDAFAALTARVGWRADEGVSDAVKVTRDGGITWRAVPAPAADGGAWSFQVIDERHGFALFAGDVFARMTDGLTWRPMPSPRGAGP